MLDYFEIGQRVRRYRKACGLSQEQLACEVGISTTHMSHIETGNTKLSLSVLVCIAKALNVQTDALLFDSSDALEFKKDVASVRMMRLLESCSKEQIIVLVENAESLKVSLDKYLS